MLFADARTKAFAHRVRSYGRSGKSIAHKVRSKKTTPCLLTRCGLQAHTLERDNWHKVRMIQSPVPVLAAPSPIADCLCANHGMPSCRLVTEAP